MRSVVSAIQNTVPISSFNKGVAGKIFREVRATGAKVVIKNNVPECVLISPEEYVQLMDELSDARLLALAQDRMSHYDPAETVSEKEMEEMFAIRSEDLDDVGEVLFE